MQQNNGSGDRELEFLAALSRTAGRRTFLRWSGITLAVAAVGCSDEGGNNPLTPDGRGGTSAAAVDLGTGDILVLNFAYALEQLEAAFYTQVIATPYSGITSEETQVLDSLRQHEIVHSMFLGEALGSNAIPALSVDFSSVDFTSRDSVLQTARTFEDLGVSAYNGAAKYLESTEYLLTAGKIVSVEARHAAAIRDLLQPRSEFFAGDDVVNEQGLDVVRTPAEVFALADPFIVTEIDTSNLPTT